VQCALSEHSLVVTCNAAAALTGRESLGFMSQLHQSDRGLIQV